MVLAPPMKCDTGNCENKGIVDVGNMVVCGRCHHGMLHGEKPVTMSDDAREQARKLVADWCDPKPPDGWTLARPGVIEAVDGTTRWIDARQGELATGVFFPPVPLEAVDVALRSMNVGSSVALAHALEAALEDGDCLRGVIARAIDASDTIADSDAEDVVQEMLQILMEPEPVGGDDDRLDELLELRGRVEKQRAELDSQRAAANERVEKLTAEWRAEVTRVLGLLTDVTRERDVLRGRVDVDENDLDEAGLIEEPGLTDDCPKIVAWMQANGFEFVPHGSTDDRRAGIWRGNVLVRPGSPMADEGVVNDLAYAVGRLPLDVLAEIAAMVIV
jgi:hypothetical protein